MFSRFSISFFQISHIFTVLNTIYDPLFTRKNPISENNSLVTPFFTLFLLSRSSDNTTSQNIGGTDAWAIPHLKFFWGAVPQSLLGLRPYQEPNHVPRKLLPEAKR